MGFMNINSFKELLNAISTVKRDKGSITTNIYPRESQYADAIREKRLVAIDNSTGFVALENKGDFFSVSFAVGTEDDILGEISNIAKDYDAPFVVEHVIRTDKDRKLGNPKVVLKRMMHQGILTLSQPLASQAKGRELISERPATEKDIANTKEIFRIYFNPLTERIPKEKELAELIEANGIFVATDGEKIVGFIIFEKEGQGLHLRYWWIDPNYRGLGIGSRLMKYYEKAAEGTARQFLWVFEDNENAIKRYRHYGFEFDSTEDDIYIFG